MDFITQLPETRKGHDAILVFVDRLSKMVHFAPTRTDVSAKGVAQLFFEHVFRLHGLPKDIVSDMDAWLTSRFWKALMSLLGTRLSMSSAFHPESDGQTERVNRTLEQMLRMFVSPAQDDWDVLLPAVEFACNSAVHDSTGETPFVLNYGRQLPAPVDRAVGDVVPAADDFVGEMRRALESAKSHLLKSQQRQKSYADSRRRDCEFQVGDEVLLSTRNLRLKSPGARKLLPKFIGPFQIVARVGDVAYRLALPDTLRIHDVFHVSLLAGYVAGKDYKPPPLPIVVDGALEYEVERVLLHRPRSSGNKTVYDYLIKWQGYGPEHNSYEPESNLPRELIDEYWTLRAHLVQQRASA